MLPDLNEDINIIQTDVDNKDGQTKCPLCGATDIELNINSGKLKCNFCRHEFKNEIVEDFNTNVEDLEGITISSGAKDIEEDFNNIVTLKCSSCGAEISIDTNETTQLRCHWCRNTLSINKQIPNGAIPDLVLPFKLRKEIAQDEIQKFVKRRNFFANTVFKKEFTTDNIMGVYFPYMIVDVNANAHLIGQGEVKTKQYTKGINKNKKTYYDADAYNVERKLDLTVEGLTLESSSDKLNVSNNKKTNNIINAIMPFDTENCVRWDANYLKGYTSEKRDVNIDTLKPLVIEQTKGIAKYKSNETLTKFDRGVCWKTENVDINGEQWKTAYLPVWLYSYYQKNNNTLHYVAVNARTKETMGSVPLNTAKLFFFSLIFELIGLLTWLLIDFDYDYLLFTLGFAFFGIIYSKYRNQNARHNYESETIANAVFTVQTEEFVEHRKKLSSPMIKGVNNNKFSEDVKMGKLLKLATNASNKINLK